MKKIFYLLCGIFCMLFLCSCVNMYFDVSKDPGYNYCFKYDHVYRTKERIWAKFSDAGKYLTNSTYQMDKYYDYEKSGDWVILPKGTLILITKIRYNTSTYILADRSMWAEGVLLNGNYKGTVAWVWLTKIRIDEENGSFVKNKHSNLVEEYPNPDVVEDLGLYSEWEKNNPTIPEPIITSEKSTKE